MKTLADVRAEFKGASRNEIDSAILTAWRCALDSVRAREPVSLEQLGCGDSSCVVRRPRGMAPNGGCRCDERTLRQAVQAWRAECDRLAALLEADNVE